MCKYKFNDSVEFSDVEVGIDMQVTSEKDWFYVFWIFKEMGRLITILLRR